MPQPASHLAIVTGTSSGIGESLARQLLEQGWSVIGVARRASPFTSPAYRHLTLDLADVGSLLASFDTSLGPLVHNKALLRIGVVNNAADVALLGQLDQVDPVAMLKAYAINTVAPVALNGWVLRNSPASASVRIVNVSSGAAVDPLPGLGAYGTTKAALRLAGMILGAELDARTTGDMPARDVTIWSYEPGVVATPMQAAVRTSTPETVPIVQVFKDLHAGGQLLDPAVPANEIATYLGSDRQPRFSEKRFLP